jgi:alkylated DNA repair protein alkB family protein 8
MEGQTPRPNSCYYEDSPVNQDHGLFVFDDVIDSAVERLLCETVGRLESVSISDPQNTVKSRTTMHFGHVFDYSTLKADPNKTVPVPKEFSQTIDRVFETVDSLNPCLDLVNWSYDQITANLYKGKSGIGSHVDTHSAFDEKIVVLNLGSPVVLRFDLPDIPDSSDGDLRKDFSHLPKSSDLWVKPRSLLIMTGQSRYLYKHRISVRNTDIDPMGDTVRRGTRISITMRRIDPNGTCDCDYPVTCDYQNPDSLRPPDRFVEMKNMKNGKDACEKLSDTIELVQWFR